ncbi:uncharacterized protein TNCV_1425281 [Trichonephila clavipes]|nr:uncharacterized protein TNCV_1425281 [Trichonephila clavipes]
MDQWTTVLITDESHFNLTSDFHRILKWREPGTRNLPSNVREIDHYGTGDCSKVSIGMMSWNPIFLESEDIRRMDRPARSPDLNFTDHVLNTLGRAIATRDPPLRAIQTLKTAILNY